MHDLKRAVRVPGNLHFVAVSSEREFRHQPLANTSTDLTISWIEFAVIRDLYDLVRPILQQHLPCGAVALAEAVDITDRPTAKFLHWACHIAADGAKTPRRTLGAEVRDNETTLDRLRDPNPPPPS